MNFRTVQKKETVHKNGHSPLFLRFTHEKKNKLVSLGVSVLPEHWDNEKQIVHPNCPDYSAINRLIQDKRNEYHKKIRKLEIDANFDTLFGVKSKQINCTVAECFQQQVDRMKSIRKIGTAGKYHYCLKLLSQCNPVNIRFEQVDMNYLRNFETYLLNKGNTSNSVASKFSVFKAVYNRALADGIFEQKDNLFTRFKVGRYWKPTRKRAINKEDVLKLKEFYVYLYHNFFTMKFNHKISFLSSIIIFFFFINQLYAQKKMSLQACIDFALENSYTVNQKMLENELNYIQLKARKISIAPSLGANVGQAFDFGRSQMPDGSIRSTTQATTNFGVGLNMDIFQGLRTYHQIQSDKLNLQATLFDIETAKENVELTITAYYLQILLNKDILEVYKAQVELAQEQVDRIELLVKNGKSSDAELYVAKSTLATDQVSVVEAINNVRLSILDLAQLMNFPDVANFEIDTGSDYADIDEILSNNIDINRVAENALQNRPAIQAALTRIEQAKRSIKIAQAGWYPTLSFSATFGTGYFYRFKDLADVLNQPFAKQFKDYAHESLGVTLYIPIFDKLSTHYNVKQQKVNVKLQKLQLEETKRRLIKEIEQAYVNAVASKEKYLASQVANTSSKVAFQYEEIKYNAGSSTNYEYNDAKNKYLKAQSSLIQAKFDFLFRIKILEFYGRD